MARIFIDGFESGDHDMWDAESNATVISSAGLDMDGDYCLDINGSTEYLRKNITATDEMYFALLYRPFTSNSSGVLTLRKDSTILVQVRRTSAGKIQVNRGSTTIDTGTCVLGIDNTYLIEIRVKIHDSTGVVDVKVDGISDITFSGNTKVGTDTQFN